MADILAPALGESVSEATVARWTKKPGEAVKKDETLVELETDKVNLEVSAPSDGVLGEITAAEGATVTQGQVLGRVSEGGEWAVKGAGKTTKAQAQGTAASAAPDGEGAPESAPAPTAGGSLAPSRQPSPDAAPPAPPADTRSPAERGEGGALLDVSTPVMGESVSEGTMGAWTKKPGDAVKKDEILVEIETDKVAVEVSSPADGALSEILAPQGASVKPGQVIARVSAGPGAGAAPRQPSGAGEQTPANRAPAAQATGAGPAAAMPLSPSVQRIVAEGGLDATQIAGSGRDGRITKADALAAAEGRSVPAQPPASAPPSTPTPQVQASPTPRPLGDREERVRMTRLRQTIARRLKEAQNSAAMLTTFNEVDMSAVMALRNTYKEAFEKRHGVKLGFMSFFVKACIAALKEIPAVNAEIEGQDLIYKNHYDIGVAVGTERGLVVPVVRDADQLSLAGIEKTIGDLGRRAREGQLAIEEMQGGTFTITNGGIYGSLMSTPILNAPQSGILGMHKIQERPMAVGGKIEIRPMMYLALSYDHRIVDGKEAVTFLVSVKDHIEDPQRLILDL